MTYATSSSNEHLQSGLIFEKKRLIIFDKVCEYRCCKQTNEEVRLDNDKIQSGQIWFS